MVQEKYDFRLLMSRYLFSRGWHRFGEETGFSDGCRVDRYPATGDERQLARVTI